MSAEREEYQEDVCPECGSADWEVRRYGVAHCNDCNAEWSLDYELS